MRIKHLDGGGIKLWLSSHDTEVWATGYPRWPGSALESHRLFVEYDSDGDLIDLTIDGRSAEHFDVDAGELNAIVEDHVRRREYPEPHYDLRAGAEEVSESASAWAKRVRPILRSDYNNNNE